MRKRKYIHYRNPQVSGLYYQDGDTYYENIDCKDAKIIVIRPIKKNEKLRKLKEYVDMKLIDKVCECANEEAGFVVEYSCPSDYGVEYEKYEDACFGGTCKKCWEQEVVD